LSVNGNFIDASGSVALLYETTANTQTTNGTLV